MAIFFKFWLSSSSTIANWPADLDWISQHSRHWNSCVWMCVCIFTQWKLKGHTPPCDSHHFMCVSALYRLLSSPSGYMCVRVSYVCRCRDDQCCSYWTVRPDSQSSLSASSTCSRSRSDQQVRARGELSWAEQANEKRWNRCLPCEREREREDGWR